MISQWNFDKQKLRKKFYSDENEEKKRFSLTNIIMNERSQIQEKYYEYMNIWKEKILFFEWF